MTSNPIVRQWIHGDPPEPDRDPYSAPPEPDPVKVRRVDLTPASAIPPKRVRWIWKDRLAMGTLGLLAGREGLGKSTLAYALAADVTRGTLEGEYHGTPRAVLVCASEDSWEHTIVPRLIAAGADLDLVYRTEIVTHDDLHMNISLPRDFLDVEYAALQVDAGLMILDPLMSVIDSRLDTHRDREVRQALEPLKLLAERGRMAILGLIHHNKSGSTDALQLVMGSKAFSAVARSVHTCIPDPDDETQTRRIFATSKNNLGRLDLPVLGFTITGHAVETVDDGTAWTGRINWTGEVAGAMHEIMTRASDPERSATTEAADWLHDYLTSKAGEAAKTDIEKAGRVAGHNPTALRRARERLRLEHRAWGFPRRTFWCFPGTAAADEEPAIDITEPRHQPDATAVASPPGDSTVEADPSRAPYTPDQPVLPVASEGDPTVTQLGLTCGNADSASRAYARAGGDDSTDMTDPMTPLHPTSRDSRASRASQVTAPPRGHAREAPPLTPDWDGPIPTCPDCGNPLDSDDHAKLCEDQP
jgi:hypothetical protein